ncbi:hypothetical protein PspLS_10485 [Pyricularia sp. CBS 133598]|nr:hypothetical protein PspLS_10485 [Pyricularia sp. CBS 133598]
MHSRSRTTTQQSDSFPNPVLADLDLIVDAFTPVRDTLMPLPFLAARLIPDNTFRIHEHVPKNVRTLNITGARNIYTTELELWDEAGQGDAWWDDMILYCNLRQWFYRWPSAPPYFQNLKTMFIPSGDDVDENSRRLGHSLKTARRGRGQCITNSSRRAP